MSNVHVDNENDCVDISYENIEITKIIEKLHDLGYPEATDENGLLLQLKNYANCVIGRVHNITHKERKKPAVLSRFFCAHDWIRTSTPNGTTPSRWHVYQFHHMGILCPQFTPKVISNKYFGYKNIFFI